MKNKPRFVTGVLLALLAGGIFTLNARHEQKNAKVSRAESKDSIPLVSIQKTIVGMPSSKITPVHQQEGLTEKEKAAFLNDVQFVFGKLALAGVDKEAMAEHLSRLNRRGSAGVEAIAQILAKPTTVNKEVRQRIALVDYLAYRARWDENTKSKIISILELNFPNNVPTKYRSVLIAERAELLGSLAALDWQAAMPLLAKISDPLFRKYAASEAAFKLAERGISFEQAKSQVRTVVPELKI